MPAGRFPGSRQGVIMRYRRRRRVSFRRRGRVRLRRRIGIRM